MLQNCNALVLGNLLVLLFFWNIKPVSAQDSLTVRYSLNARGTFKTGRLNQTVLSLDGNYALTAEHWKTEFFSNYKYLKTNGRIGENELFGRAIISIFPKKRWFPIIGYIFNESELYQIRSRHTSGMGIGYKLVKKPSNTVNFYTWAAYEDTKFRNISGYTTFRINTFVVGNHNLIPDKLSLQYTLYYLQSIEVSDNYIWRIEPTLLLPLSRKFSLTISLDSHFENIIDSANTKQNSSMTIGVKFQNI